MDRLRQWFATRSAACALWVGLCFALTSAAYLSWLDRLLALTGSESADWLSMVAAYLFQAAGMAVACLRLKTRPDSANARTAALAIGLFALMSAPAILTRSAPAAVAFGMLMNLAYGVVAGQYMYAIAIGADANQRGIAFGGGYAAATVAVGLMALVADGSLLRGGTALLIYLPLAAITAWAASRLAVFRPPVAEAPAAQDMAEPDGKSLALTCAVIVMISAVKNLGFSFPSADIASGLNPQVSRMPYAIGLVAAGVIIDKNRKNGMMCTLAAMALPFIMLGLASEPVPSAICWGLDYLFFGFFSVFRVTLFLDIAARTRRWELAPAGLLMGRLGDVAGTGAALLLHGHRIALIALTAVLFVPAVFMLLRQFQRLYEPEVVRQRSEQETFEAFCMRSDLSAREREVLRMILANHSNASISEALFISESTVKYHVRNVLQKTGCKNRSELQKKYTLALYPQLKDDVERAARSENA